MNPILADIYSTPRVALRAPLCASASVRLEYLFP